MKKRNLALLPSGLIDLLPPDAAIEADAVQCMIKQFELLGYDRVKPPLAEFEESLFAPGPGQAVARDAFRLMDPVSRKMMALRSDTTAQIARIASTRMAHVERPLRLAYAGEVLRIKGGQIRPNREFMKVGCELIGSYSVEADIEVAVLSLCALSSVGISGITIDLTLPPLVRLIYEHCEIDQDEQAVLDSSIERRDRDGIRAYGGKVAELLEGLVSCMGPAETALPKLNSMELPEEAAKQVKTLSCIAEGVKSAITEMGMENIQITIDPVERRGFDYQTGFAFALFAKGERGELGRGGRYNINDCEENSIKTETAVGFTFYMDTLRRIIPASEPKEKLSVPSSKSWSEIARLQSEGVIVVRDFNAGKE